jgi:hypothetical protein
MMKGKGEKKERKKRHRKNWLTIRPLTDTPPSANPFLKAVVPRQDLGAAGTEFERSLIVSLFKNIFPFPPSFLTFLLPSLLPRFECQSFILSR